MLAALITTATAALLLPPLSKLAPQQAAKTASKTVHLKIGGKWYDATDWADKHPGGRYVLDWADGFDVTNAFHTIHLFSSKKASDILARMPEADLSTRETRQQVLPPIDRVPMSAQQPTGMDKFMAAGERVVELMSPPAATLPAPVPVAPASGLAWQQPSAAAAEGAVGETPLKRDLEEMLRRHFASPAEYKATPEHWARIAAAFALWARAAGGECPLGLPWSTAPCARRAASTHLLCSAASAARKLASASSASPHVEAVFPARSTMPRLRASPAGWRAACRRRWRCRSRSGCSSRRRCTSRRTRR